MIGSTWQSAESANGERPHVLRDACAALTQLVRGILRKTFRPAHGPGGTATRTRAQAEKNLRSGEPEFAGVAKEIERQILGYLQGSAAADTLRDHLRVTLAWADQARHLVDKAIGEGDFDQRRLEMRREGLMDLETMIHGKLEWLAKHANRGSVRQALGTSGSVMHFLVIGSDGPAAWLILMNWTRDDDIIAGYSPHRHEMVSLPQSDIVDWRAG